MRTAFYKYVGLGLIAFTLTTASAQDRNEGSREQKLQQLKKDLNLTDAQVIKIKQIEDSYKDEKLELKKKMKNKKFQKKHNFHFLSPLRSTLCSLELSLSEVPGTSRKRRAGESGEAA